jgi:isopentenyl-diphosphate delta-isomerase
MEDQLILVNQNDEMIGVGPKLAIHRQGLLHRAFSIFIFNSSGELLLQRRALSKYHSPGLWSNTCCGHPRPSEQLMTAAQRRLRAEMGLDCRLEGVGSFLYRADVGGGLVEHELDHLFVGYSNFEPTPHPDEVDDWKWIDFASLRTELTSNAAEFSCWLRIVVNTQLHRLSVVS